MKRTIVLVAALSLGGCAALQNAWTVVTGTTVTPQQAYIAANAFDTIEATATQYLSLPACGSTASKLCRTSAGAAAIVPAIRIGRTARNNLEAAITASGGQPIAISLYSALTAQTTTLQQLVTTYNIRH